MMIRDLYLEFVRVNNASPEVENIINMFLKKIMKRKKTSIYPH